MKICHVLWGLTYGGIETMVVNIANAQTELGHNVSLLIVNDLIEDTLVESLLPKVNFICLKRKVGSKNPFYVIKLNMVLKNMGCDIIHLHHVKLYNYLLPSLKRITCTTHHTDCVRHLIPFIPRIPRLISISNYVHDDILNKLSKNSDVVLNGINPRLFSKKCKNDVYDGKRQFKIVQVGRLDHKLKGQDVLIKAASLLREKGVDFKIDIIGDGPSMNYLQELVSKDNLFGQVELKGAMSYNNIAKALASYDLLVQPSRLEGFGLTIIEGMAAKVPVLVSDIGAQLEVINKGECGYVFKSEDANSCADAIERIIKNYDLEIVEKAYERVYKMYDVAVTASNYIEEYKKFIAERSK